ncbi:GlxA family transcriptional regulator [Rhizobium sp. RU36D]|uniref:GlxA family transcriptional regulator n=1 Tax=Rhizobium sp. RU36D TaxID=1907415 RepID=UPI0009D8FD50|nr:GlxA family transcriptional regulator [Rhizobium sp. RU36D]SMD01803.1 transcriptional regulator, AraC family with amidase-like domain [Rhizobium sp. RU36D]
MKDTDSNIQDIGFILIPGFALMCFASAVEPLRAANLLAGSDLYRVHVYSPTGEAVPSSSGAVMPAEPLAKARRERLHSVFVVAGGHPSGWQWPAVHAALRGFERDGVRIGGISGGPYLLAAAGLLADHRFTIHWEHAPALVEDFPGLKPEQARYIFDRNRLTCGGGVAPLDMMHALILARFGPAFATRVSDWYLHTHVASAAEPQRASLVERHGLHHPALLAVLEKMEATIEHPLNRTAMARLAGITPRHLDRLFAEHLGSSFLREYRRLRLEQARMLLQQSALSVSEIAFACGFSSPGHFARRYKELYGTTPKKERG